MIIISARKFRDSQNEILKKALSEEVILTTLHFGNFRLVPIVENKTEESEAEHVKKKTRATRSKGKAIMQELPPINGQASESVVTAGNPASAGSLASVESSDAAGNSAAARKLASAGSLSSVERSDAAGNSDAARKLASAGKGKTAAKEVGSLLFPDLFETIETERNSESPASSGSAPERAALSGSAPESTDAKAKARSRKTSDPSRHRGKALPNSVNKAAPDSDTPVMNNIPQWASGSDAASVSQKPEAPALAEVVVSPDASAPAAISGAHGHHASAAAHSPAAAAAPAFEGGEGDYSDRFDDNGNPRLVSAGKHARDTREDPMSEEERTAAFERLRERARQVREGVSQKDSASESPDASAAHPKSPASRPAVARHLDASDSAAHPAAAHHPENSDFAAQPVAARHPENSDFAALPEYSNSEGDPKASAPTESKAKEANVYVDPSLMSLDEYYKQAGIELEPQKKGGFFSKIFGKK